MANWLTKVFSPPAGQGRNLPVRGQNRPLAQGRYPSSDMPNASVVYGVAASFLFILGVYFLFTGRWFTCLLVLFPAACFLGFSLHFMKHR